MHHHDAQGMVEAPPLDGVDFIPLTLREAFLLRFITVLEVLELDEEGLWVVEGDSDLILA